MVVAALSYHSDPVDARAHVLQRGASSDNENEALMSMSHLNAHACWPSMGAAEHESRVMSSS